MAFLVYLVLYLQGTPWHTSYSPSCHPAPSWPHAGPRLRARLESGTREWLFRRLRQPVELELDGQRRTARSVLYWVTPKAAHTTIGTAINDLTAQGVLLKAPENITLADVLQES